jgi:hypothetical protein
MPDKITIYQGAHERSARTRAQLEQMVADTVWGSGSIKWTHYRNSGKDG